MKKITDFNDSDIDNLSNLEIKKFINDLKNRQIELEIQNEELIKTQQKSYKSEDRSFQLFYNSPVGFVVLNKNFNIKTINMTFEKMFNRSLSELQDIPFVDLIDDQYKHLFLQHIKSIKTKTESKVISLKLSYNYKYYFVNIKFKKTDALFSEQKDENNILLSINNITGEKLYEDKINHLNSVLNAIRKVNQLISLEKNIDILLQKICDNLSESREYSHVWIARYIDNQSKKMKVFGKKDTQHFNAFSSLLENGESVECIEILKSNQNQYLIFNSNIDCKNCPVVKSKKTNVSITIKLVYNKILLGYFSVALPSTYMENNEEIDLLLELSNDIAFAINNHIINKNREKAEQNLKGFKDFLHSTLNSLSSHIAILDSKGIILEVNEAWKKFGDNNGFKSQNYGIGLNYLEVCKNSIIKPNDRASQVYYGISKIIETQKGFFEMEYPCHGPDQQHWFILRVTHFLKNNNLNIVVSHEDITLRKLTEIELKKNELKLKNIFNNSLDSLYFHKQLENGTPGQILEVNDSAIKMLGYSRDEFLKMSPEDFDNKLKKGAKDIIKVMEKSTKRGELTFETEHIAKNDQIIPVEVRSYIYKEGKENLTISSVRDISNRKKMIERLQKIFDSIESLIFLSDVKTHQIQFMNQSFRKVFGNLSGQKCYQKIFDSNTLCNNCICKNLNSNNKTAKSEIFDKKRNKWFHISEKYINWVDNAKVILHVISDITTSKNNEIKINESKEQLELFFNQQLAGFFFMMLDEPVEWNDQIDKDKILDYVFDHQKITKINKAMLNQYKAKKKDFIGLAPKDFFSHDIDHGKKIWRNFFDKGKLTINSKEKKFDNTEMWVEGSYICTYDNQGKITGHLGIQQEVTTRKKAELKLKQSELRYKSLVDNSPDMIAEIKYDGTILTCNQKFAKYFSTTKSKMIGEKIFNLLYNDVQKKRENQIIKAITTTKPIKFHDMHDNIYFENIIIPNIKNETVQIISKDITEETLASKKIKLNEEKLRLIVSSMSDMVFIINTEGKFIDSFFSNDSESQFWNANFIGKSVKKVMPKQFCETFNIALKNLQSEGTDQEFEFFLPYSNRKQWYRSKLTKHANNNDIVLIIHNITDYKNSRNKIEEQKDTLNIFQLGFDQSPVSILLTDEKGNIQYVNKFFENLTGYKFEEVINKNPKILNSGENKKDLYKNLWKTITEGQVWKGVFKNKKKNSEIYWEEAIISPVIKNGKITNFVAIKEDITQKRFNEKRLSQLASFPEQNPNPIIALNMDYKIIYYNKHVGEKFKDFTQANLKHPLLIGIKTIVEKMKKEGNNFHSREIEVQNDYYDQFIYMLSEHNIIRIFYHDITKIKENMHKANEAKIVAEIANKTKSQFLANMSHELRTPLNSIIGFSQVLEDELFGILNPKQHKYVNNVLMSGNHLLDLINDILDLSKVEAGKMELDLSPIQIVKIINNSIIMVKERAFKHQIKLSTDIDEKVKNQKIFADERKLKQILFNLLSNAIKFTPEGGKITISCGLDSDFLRINVADTGIGLKKEDQELVFQKFKQVDSSVSKKYKGTGLGLSLTKQMVELHGGTISVFSDGVNQGSTFSFTIPLKQKLNQIRNAE